MKRLQVADKKKTSWLLYSVLVLVLGKMYIARTMTPAADKTSVFCCDVLFVAERSGTGDADTGQWWFMGSHLQPGLYSSSSHLLLLFFSPLPLRSAACYTDPWSACPVQDLLQDIPLLIVYSEIYRTARSGNLYQFLSTVGWRACDRKVS